MTSPPRSTAVAVVPDRFTPLLPLTLGVAMTLALSGYRFGESNHAVYLVDALRQNDPGLLTNDWWTQSTLQYHFVFNKLSAWLMRIGLIEPAFLGGFLGLIALLHVAWRRLTLALGGNDAVYLASVILFQLMAAGTGLGMYQFMQDSSFLPSNVANVAMLWGVYAWVRGRWVWAGFALGIAGLFHLNHALAGIGMWMGLGILETSRTRRTRMVPSSPYSGERDRVRGRPSNTRVYDPPLTPTLSPAYGGEGVKPFLIGAMLLVALSLSAIVPAVKTVLSKTSSLPLRDFVDLYVRLRHPHHYDPSSWPAALWLTFLIPIGITVFAYRTAPRTAVHRRAADVFGLFLAMLAVALLGAGIFYISEPLIQMSLYRFSIFPKLLSCIAVASLLCRWRPGPILLRTLVMGMFLVMTGLVLARVNVPSFIRANAQPIWMFALFASVAMLRPRVLGWGRIAFGGLTTACVIATLALSWHHLGIVHEGLRGDDAGYMELCRWVEQNTPRDAVFVVPPDEQSFRLHARRAIVVNFKNVPQLSGELVEWRDRLEAVLDLKDLRTLPRPFYQTLDAIRVHYGNLSAEQLVDVATRYHARYVVTVHPFHTPMLGEPLFSDPGGRYFLYDLEGRRDQRLASEPAKRGD